MRQTAKRRGWSQPELLVAFRLYCRTPFGKLHQHNPEIIELSRRLRRTPSAVAMKACNFASLDPTQRKRKIRALENVSKADTSLWQRFEVNPNEVAFEAENAFANLYKHEPAAEETEFTISEGPTEVEQVVRARRIQGFFRDAVLVSYGNKCALSGLSLVELLNASHIIPWSVSKKRRADPRNGIALNALYDRAFDRGLLTFDASLRVVLSRRLRTIEISTFGRVALLKIEGQKLRNPVRFAPDPAAIEWHRENRFLDR